MVQFMKDVNMLQQSDASVKVVIGSPEIIADTKMYREFRKIVLSQRRSGTIIHGDMLNGHIILNDMEYVDNEIKELFFDLINKIKKVPKIGAELKIISLVPRKATKIAEEAYNIVGKLVCSGNRIVNDIDASLQFLQMETPVRLIHRSNKGKIIGKKLKDLTYTWSPDGSGSRNTRGELKQMRQGDSIFVIFPNAVGVVFAVGNSVNSWRDFLVFANGSKYLIKLLVRGISGSNTVCAEKIIKFVA